MGIFSERQINRYLRSVVIAVLFSVIRKLSDTLIAEEWVDLLENIVFVFLFLTFLKWLWFRALGADRRADERQRKREQADKTTASRDDVGAITLGSTVSQNNPRNL